MLIGKILKLNNLTFKIEIMKIKTFTLSRYSGFLVFALGCILIVGNFWASSTLGANKIINQSFEEANFVAISKDNMPATSGGGFISLQEQSTKTPAITQSTVTTDPIVSFRGDWETGQLTGNGNWRAIQQDGLGGMTLLHDGGARQGIYYARVELGPATDSNSQRSEVVDMTTATGGLIRENESSGTQQYSFSVKFDASWQTIVPLDNNGAWGIFFQLHPDDRLLSNPAIELGATDQIRLGARTGDIVTNRGRGYDLSNDGGSLNKGHWIDFILTVKYAKDSTGFIKVQRRDEGQTSYREVLNLQNMPTLQYSSNLFDSAVLDHYWKHGLYRSHSNLTSILYNDGMTRSVVYDTNAPSVPTGLVPSKIGQTSFTLNWSASIDDYGVAGYEVFKDGTSIGTTTTTSMSVTGLSLGTTYSMTVRARDAVPNWSEQSTALNVTTSTTPDMQAPSTPTGLAPASIGPTSFILSWTASTDNMDVTGYEVFKDGTSIGTTTTTSMSVTGLSAGTAYSMKVRARDAIPNWSEQSTALNVTTLAAGGSISSNATWQSFDVSIQTGTFTAEFDAVPYIASMDGVTGIQNGTATAYSSLACAVQFATDGRILARNAGTYTADKTVNYIVGTSCHFRLVINIPAHTYSIYVTPFGQSEITLGSDYAFRTDQAGVTQLTGWSLRGVDPGTHTVSNMTFTPIVTGLGIGVIENKTFVIYPNPANSNLNIRTDFTQGKNAEIKIYDVLGKEVFRKKINASVENINISNLWSGIYFLTLQANDELEVQKLIVQH